MKQFQKEFDAFLEHFSEENPALRDLRLKALFPSLLHQFNQTLS